MSAMEARRLTASNLPLQKLLYFAHGIMLTRHGVPLVDGYFEAWEYGPVHPLIYATFKAYGSGPITLPARRRDLRTGMETAFPAPVDDRVDAIIDQVVSHLGRQRPTRLVHISHAVGGPWDYIANQTGTRAGYGLRISDTVIKDRFHRHMVAVGNEDREDVRDESPPA
ncbi:MAG: SocA family protein [Caulobacterales bacterium]|nr:SocA family protein [Caulobacterales bacterium]